MIMYFNVLYCVHCRLGRMYLSVLGSTLVKTVARSPLVMSRTLWRPRARSSDPIIPWEEEEVREQADEE